MRLYLIIIFFGCGNSSIAQQSEARVNTARKWVKRTILKSFNFLPYIEYKPSIVPSETGEVLLKDLNIFEKITDDHILFEERINEKLKKERGNRIDEIYDAIIRKRRLSRKRKRKDPIEEKISDINYIRGLTQRYESWSPKWSEKVDLAKEDLTVDEIDLVQYQLRRISKKHRHLIFKQKI